MLVTDGSAVQKGQGVARVFSELQAVVQISEDDLLNIQIGDVVNVLLDIDPQGARAVMEKEPDCVSIFILPPSYRELRVRLVTRNTEQQEEIERRLGNARAEIAQMNRYRYLIVNDDLDLAFEQLQAVVRAEKQNAIRYFPEIED